MQWRTSRFSPYSSAFNEKCQTAPHLRTHACTGSATGQTVSSRLCDACSQHNAYCGMAAAASRLACKAAGLPSHPAHQPHVDCRVHSPHRHLVAQGHHR